MEILLRGESSSDDEKNVVDSDEDSVQSIYSSRSAHSARSARSYQETQIEDYNEDDDDMMDEAAGDISSLSIGSSKSAQSTPTKNVMIVPGCVPTGSRTPVSGIMCEVLRAPDGKYYTLRPTGGHTKISETQRVKAVPPLV